jgi:hypothetical protein
MGADGAGCVRAIRRSLGGRGGVSLLRLHVLDAARFLSEAGPIRQHGGSLIAPVLRRYPATTTVIG